MTGDKTARAHALRAAINTPIQGGAADIAMLAMLQIERSRKLRDLGFELLMQARGGPASSLSSSSCCVRVSSLSASPFRASRRAE